jgi:hypothetical protein
MAAVERMPSWILQHQGLREKNPPRNSKAFSIYSIKLNLLVQKLIPFNRIHKCWKSNSKRKSSVVVKNQKREFFMLVMQLQSGGSWIRSS